MARSRKAAVRDDTAELAQIENYYRDLLAEPAVLPDAGHLPDGKPIVPSYIGPTWQTTPDGYWLLPEHSLGWQSLAWCGKWLQLSRDEPWVFTLEQARWWLWWYAIDDDGEFLYRDGTLQRLKGWGKDPVGATLCTVELIGPCRFSHWDGDRPVAVEHPEAWVQTAAVSLEQTKNTMRLLPSLYTPALIKHYGVSLGKETVHALGSSRLFQAVTSSPATLEGARATFVLLNETQHWDSSNSGHDMAAVIERNATKSKDGSARTLRITNAYEPGMDSVAEQDRESFNAVLAGTAVATGLMYDSIEAPPEAPLTADAAPAVVAAIRGDAEWLDSDRIVKSILDVRNPPSRSRRFWYNQITAAEDAWLDPKEVDLAAKAGDGVSVEPGEAIVAFLDGSKSDDSTGLVGCRVSDGFLFQVGVWQKDDKNDGWIVPLADVERRVQYMFNTWDVRAFWADPSDARDDTNERFFGAPIDGWHQRFGEILELWATGSGDHRHAVAWDMRSPTRTQQFTVAAQQFVSEIESFEIAFDGSEALKQHLKNARRRPNKYGVSLGKEHRESRRKVDLAVCAVGARMLRRLLVNKYAGEKPRGGRIW